MAPLRRLGSVGPWRFLWLAPVLVSLSGCSTHRVGLSYRPDEPAGPPVGSPVFAIAEVVDRREKRPIELGVVRGGYGNVLKRLHTSEPVRDLVQRAFEDALRARGLLAPGGEILVLLRISVARLDCNYFMNREAHARFDLEARDAKTGKLLWERGYEQDLVESGIGAGIFANVDHLRGMAEKAMIQAIDEAVSDSQLRYLAAQPP